MALLKDIWLSEVSSDTTEDSSDSHSSVSKHFWQSFFCQKNHLTGILLSEEASDSRSSVRRIFWHNSIYPYKFHEHLSNFSWHDLIWQRNLLTRLYQSEKPSETTLSVRKTFWNDFICQKKRLTCQKRLLTEEFQSEVASDSRRGLAGVADRYKVLIRCDSKH